MTAPLAQTLLQTPLFQGLTEAEAQLILAISQGLSIGDGEALFQEGEPGDALLVVLGGELEILKKNPAGGQRTLARLSEGQVLGEVSLLGGGGARSATARAARSTQLLRISADRFSELLQQDSVPALKVVRNLAQVISRRLLRMNERLVEVPAGGGKKEELAEFHRLLSDWSF